ncbi:MAG: ABC transporter permease [Brachybacterium sp.]|uniref:ABC transporter permease n=1 Tax=Brachybacterium sp. TaxID=1891286 RepID=UPI00264A49C7|nr:ABC transporter permease [Brachybacterium sp.]MDN5687601.1 ABC transporter permease [Brachybacterium sp.]
MTTSDALPVEAAASAEERPARAPVWRSFLRPAPLAAALVVVISLLSAIFASQLSALSGNDPFTFHADALGADTAPLGAFGGISGDHWFGVEPGTGRDLFSLVVHGARVSLLVGIASTVLATVIGVVLGVVAGSVGGIVEKLVDFATDVTLGFPFLIFAIALSALFPLEAPRALLLTLVIGMFGWPGIARVVAAETRVIVHQPYVVASRVMGARFVHLFRHQVLPNVASTVIVYSCISLPGRISAEATLSFLGVGVLPPTPSWGRSIGDAISWLLVDPAFLLFPAAALFLVTFSFNILGDTLRDALDPRGVR